MDSLAMNLAAGLVIVSITCLLAVLAIYGSHPQAIRLVGLAVPVGLVLAAGVLARRAFRQPRTR